MFYATNVMICLMLTNGVMFIGRPIKILLEPIQTVLSMEMGKSDAMGQSGAVAVMTVGVLYLLFYTFRIKK